MTIKEHQADLLAMSLELQANRSILNGLSQYYVKFRFTGGNVTAERWGLAAITHYRDRPFAADRIVTAEAERYRQLTEAIMELGQTVAGSGPKTLRCRFGIADTFAQFSAEIRALGNRLESAVTRLLAELEPSSLFEQGFTIEPVKLLASPTFGVGTVSRR